MMLDIRCGKILCRRECRDCENYDGDLLGYFEEEVIEETEDDEEEVLHHPECD
jgi:hypothetical protein